MNSNRVLLLDLRRVRLLAILAGLAWLLALLAGLAWLRGIRTPTVVRLLLVAVLALSLALVVDMLANAGMRPGPVRLTGWGRAGGEQR